jgi:hypothetical protein
MALCPWRVVCWRLLTNGVSNWEWHLHQWGVVLELRFSDDERREQFRSLPTMQAALDAVPDPVAGLLVYLGRGGGAGTAVPRRPRPTPLAGAVALGGPVPVPPTTLASSFALLAR